MAVSSWEDAQEAFIFLGDPPKLVNPTESDLGVCFHDLHRPRHDADFRCFAAFPPPD